ncbi:MAG: SDR family NAD(P)-dependent oxidoreductase [Mycobacteriaceae bacterium]|nr:SDR family NAD(P)-dependent oxidoreductase [Mycobacteriaceae bacterium]
MTELRFDGHVVAITGAGRGVGRSHALHLAAKGARVVVADYGVDIDGAGSSALPAEDVVREIKETGADAVACYADVTESRSATSIVETALDTFGRIDAVINNAGIHDPGGFDELSIAQYRAMLDVHFFGALFVTRAAWPHFVKAGCGRVVNTVSEAMLGGIPGLSSYGAAKGAVFGLTRNLATEGAPHAICVNAIAPRAYTRMSASHSKALAQYLDMPEEVMDQINASMPPKLCAPAAAFLAHESCPLNGEVLQVGMGGVSRIAVVHTPGITKSPLTAEDIADNIDAIMDARDARVTDTVSIEQH